MGERSQFKVPGLLELLVVALWFVVTSGCAPSPAHEPAPRFAEAGEVSPSPAEPVPDESSTPPKALSADELFALAHTVRQADRDRAIDLYSQAAGKGHDAGWRELGYEYALSGLEEEASRHWSLYLELQPDAPDARAVRMAQACLRRLPQYLKAARRASAAVSSRTRVLDERPKPPAGSSASALYKRARRHYSTDPDTALELYAQASRMGHVRAWRQLGSMYAMKGDSAQAVKHWKAYLELKPRASDAEVIRNAIVRHGGMPL